MLKFIFFSIKSILSYLTIIPESPSRLALTGLGETAIINGIADKRIIVIGLFGSNEGALLTRVDLRDGLAGSIIYSAAMAANGGGFSHQPNRTWRLGLGRSLTAQLSVASNSFVTAEYYWE